MLRRFLAIFGGLMAGFWLILGITKLGNLIYPPPAFLDFAKPETIDPASIEQAKIELAKIELAIKSTPTGMLWILLLAWALGTFVSAGIAARIAPTGKIGHGLAIGGIFLFSNLVQLLPFPYPVWFKIAGAAVFLPMAYLGARLVTLAQVEKPIGFADSADPEVA
jgi:hypothetical protein